ncbi:MAG: cytochrome c-550 PedF [Thauera sp.]|nr:cytochrome c-550 PedF [Thauera sp.]MBP7641035.1 cytochrome c-550 PedF [Thauera sp.]
MRINKVKTQTLKETLFRRLALGTATIGVVAAATFAHAHGDVTPQAVDTSSLTQLGADWRIANPYRDNADAIRIGDSAFNQNCARCHGLGAVSGGIAPDLRYLERGDEMDEFFIGKVRNGVTRNGAVYMPPFEGMLTQEAMWAIRAWLETVHEEQ